MVNLKELIKKRIICDMIRSVQPSSKWKIVVIDAKSLKILNNACKMHDILEENVSLVEDISRKRTSYSTKDAIYFLSASADSVAALIDDFSKGGKPMYASAHVFFTSALPDALFEKIKKAGIAGFIKTLQELNIDFIAAESQVFTVDLPNSLYALYNPPTPSTLSHEITAIARRLLSVFSTTSEFPFIRYYDPRGEKRSLSCRLATALQQELDALREVDPEFARNGGGTAAGFKRPILIVVERAYDLMAPLLHEFTYQAMMNDLLTLEGGKYIYQSEGDSTAQRANLDETDPIWMLIRHWHFAEAVEYIRENFNRFLSENKAAVSALGHDPAASGLDSLSKMKDTLTALPQFQDMKSKFSAHINICQESKTIFERRKLDSLAALEQDLAMGETADGRVPRNVMIDMVPLLDEPTIPATDKLRLLILYIISQEGIQDSDRRRLLEVSKLSLEDSQAITNLSHLGVRLTGTGDKRNKANMNKYSYYGRVAEKKKKKKKKGADDQLPYDLSRFVPLVKYLLEDQIANTLDADIFPWVQVPTAEEIASATHPASGTAAAGAGAAAKSVFSGKAGGVGAGFQPLPNAANPHSLRTTRPSWSRPKAAGAGGGGGGGSGGTAAGDGGGGGGGGGGNGGAADPEDMRRNGPRIVLFVMGGLTFSEMRASYEVAKESRRDIVIGSTSIVNPVQFVSILKELHKTEGHLTTGGGSAQTSLTNLAGANSASTSPSGSITLLADGGGKGGKDGGGKDGGAKPPGAAGGKEEKKGVAVLKGLFKQAK